MHVVYWVAYGRGVKERADMDNMDNCYRMSRNLDQHLVSRLAMTRRIGRSLLKCEIPIAATSKVLELVINSRGDTFQTIVDRRNGRFYLWHDASQVWLVHNLKGEPLQDVIESSRPLP